MPQGIATIVVFALIVGLFVLDRDRAAPSSKALWIPFVYVLIVCSRPVSFWIGSGDVPSEAIYTSGLYSSPIDQAYGLVMLALASAALIKRRGKIQLLLRRNGPLVIFYVYGALSMMWSDFPYVTLKHWIKAAEDLVMVMLVWTEIDPAVAIRRVLTRAGFILIPLSLLFSRYYPNIGRSFNKDWDTLYNGVAETKNELGVICLIFGLVSLWCLFTALSQPKGRFRNRRLMAHCGMLALVWTMLGMAHCMTASVSLIISGAAMVIVSYRSARLEMKRVHITTIGALSAALVPMFIAPSLVKSLGRDTTFSGRTAIWHILPTFVRNPWLGAGYETFLMGPRLEQLKAIIDKTFQEAHNGYIEVWLNLGWVGVCLFALFLFMGYRKIAGAFRSGKALGTLRLAFFLAVVIEGLTEASFRMMSPTWVLLLWAAVGDPIAVCTRARSKVHSRQFSLSADIPESEAFSTPMRMSQLAEGPRASVSGLH